ncbi:molybdopterin converting factor subunit 2 [Piptocephalis cylindrospora]|uniref:Molybdopterin converting factor subunit 2 n=1 Tax=Piptocephalis cylindrospora TaxID=1907219 RepID=A0A4P9XZX1_9FUNG|nr:molybdopterin converting factor subunit 2 [Piptocephalis cylindrospora]|eukprot:RKP11712.1 molybdopterin converting factor subunit 2 [Piptocephalis cylindrospora]
MYTSYSFTHEPLSLEALVSKVESKQAGAISTFIGTTRDTYQGKKVLRLEYQAYEDMALHEFEQLGKKASRRWSEPPLLALAIIHRLGLVLPGEASVMIAVASAHRRESLEAVQYLIDALKNTIPIWKREVLEGEGGSEEAVWRANAHPTGNEKGSE